MSELTSAQKDKLMADLPIYSHKKHRSKMNMNRGH